MDFDFTPEEKAFFKALDDKLSPFGDDLDRCDLAAAEASLRAGLGLLAETPYLRVGNEALDPPISAPALLSAMEQVGSVSPSLLLAAEASARLFGRAVAELGDEAQRQRWLTPIVQGEKVGALGLSEATINVVNDPLETRGERSGEAFLVTGRKGLVVNAPLADSIAVVGQLEGGLALFLFERGAPGLSIGERVETAAYGGLALAPVELEGCPAADVLGPRPAAELLSLLRGLEDQALTGAALGQMKRALVAARKHAKTHKTGGKPIIAYQEVSFQLAEMLTLAQTSQLLAFRAAWAREAGEADAAELSDCAKVFCTESAEAVCSRALQILAAEGLRRGHPVSCALGCAKFGQVTGTSSELARVRLGDSALRRWS